MAEKKTKQAATEVTETAEPAKAKAPAKKAKKSEPAPKKYSMDGRYRLYARYVEEIVPALMNERGYKNVMQVPRIDKIVVNMRLGDVKDNAKSIQTAIGELGLITGQKPVVCKAKKSVANFKVREGMTIGAKVTLRGLRAYEFFDKLVPRMHVELAVHMPDVGFGRAVRDEQLAFDGSHRFVLRE